MSDFAKNIKSKIIRIGNSQGIRIPQMLLKQLHLDDEVEMLVEDNQLIVRSARRARHTWKMQFERSHKPEAEDDDALPQLSDWDGNEWSW